MDIVKTYVGLEENKTLWFGLKVNEDFLEINFFQYLTLVKKHSIEFSHFLNLFELEKQEKIIESIVLKEKFYYLVEEIEKLTIDKKTTNTIVSFFDYICDFKENPNHSLDYYRKGIFFLKKRYDEYYCEIIYYEKKSNKESESDYQKRIIKNFDKIFPNYKIVKQYYKIKGLGIIDILAKEKTTNRDVIIELKVDKKNPTLQLLAYSSNFYNPIMVAVTKEEVLEKNNKVNYIVYI